MKKIKLFIIKWILPFTKKAAITWLESEGYKIIYPNKENKNS